MLGAGAAVLNQGPAAAAAQAPAAPKKAINSTLAKAAGRLGIQIGQANVSAAQRAKMAAPKFSQGRLDDARDIYEHVDDPEYPEEYINYVRRQLVGQHIIRAWLRTLQKATFGETVKFVDQAPQSWHKKGIQEAYSLALDMELHALHFHSGPGPPRTPRVPTPTSIPTRTQQVGAGLRGDSAESFAGRLLSAGLQNTLTFGSLRGPIWGSLHI